METWQLALVVISAVLVGALLPLIATYRSTLKRLEVVIRDNEANFRKTMTELSEFSVQLNKMGLLIGSRSKNLDHILESIEGITDGVRKLGGSVRTASMVGAAVAPAVTAAIRAYQKSHESRESDDGNGVEDDNNLAWVEPREGEERRS